MTIYQPTLILAPCCVCLPLPGNPLVLWPMLFFLALTAVLVAAYVRYKREPGLGLDTHFSSFFSVVAFCVLTYSLNLLPYIAVNRSAFCYHYMPALMYAEVLSALTMDRLFGEREGGFGGCMLLYAPREQCVAVYSLWSRR